MQKFTTVIILILILSCHAYSQTPKRDKGKFIEYKNEFWEEIKKSVEEFENQKDTIKPKLTFKMDFSNYDLPKSIKEFKYFWHNTPISQGWSGMCWCFSTTSFFESEIKRIYNKEIKLSELHTVYYEYIEKARRFVRQRGNSSFEEGSEANAVKRIWQQYGCVPGEIYTGMKEGQKFHGHNKMFNEMTNYLNSVKQSNAWNEEVVLSTIKSILNHYIGEPPKEFTWEGKTYTPKSFLKEYIKLNMDDYVDIMSLMEKPYYHFAEYPVVDNWWHSEEYFNVPLDDFMEAIKNAIQNGYTFEIGGDVSETGYDSHSEVAMIPTYDIPSEYIDENARQFRFSNKTTTDDHGIHLIGYKKDKNGKYWFLIKDSGSGSRNGNNKGYYFYHEDYVKLKMMTFFIHKDAVKDLLKKLK